MTRPSAHFLSSELLGLVEGFILHPPISYAQWVEYGVCSGSINDFFAALMTVQPDAHTVAISKLPPQKKGCEGDGVKGEGDDR